MKLRKYLLLMLLALLGGAASAAELPLSARATASVITCGEGNEFYLAFGHSAIRIVDPEQQLDYVYNFGTFDFSVPHFYWRFAQGKLLYRLSRNHFERFMETYYCEGRCVWEQPLHFSQQQVCNLYCLLEYTYGDPALRNYKYDFFLDNCATRVVDMVAAANGQPLALNLASWQEGMSYRNYVHRAAGPTRQWWQLGVDLLLGLPADKHCTATEATFYPLVLMEELENEDNHLCGEAVNLLADLRRPLHRSFPPIVVFTLLFCAVVIFSLFEYKGCVEPLWSHTVDRLLFIIAGVLGLVLCFMWFGTDHACTKWNLNLLWLCPWMLLIAVKLERSPRWAVWLQLALLIGAVVYVLWCGVSLAVIPIVLTLAVRLGRYLVWKER